VAQSPRSPRTASGRCVLGNLIRFCVHLRPSPYVLGNGRDQGHELRDLVLGEKADLEIDIV
jgi:hypothetical protein